MHLLQFFLELGGLIDLKCIVFGLPEMVPFAELGKVVWSVGAVPRSKSKAGSTLPTVDETTRLPRFWKPNQCMNVARYHHESNTHCLELLENFVKPAETNTLGMIVIEKTSATIDGERNEVHIKIGIDDPAVCPHEADFGAVCFFWQPLVARPHR